MKKTGEKIVHFIFFLPGLITVGCVLLISIYLVVSGIPAIRQIGLGEFLFGKVWASTAAEPRYGILPFILTSIYGTAGAILLGVPIGFLTVVYLAKLAPPKIKNTMQAAVSLLAGIPLVVYGLVGMMVLVPGIRKVFHVPDGASLLAATIVREPKNRPAEPSGGCIRVGGREVAGHPYGGAAGLCRRCHYRLHSFGRAHSGRIGSAAFYGRVRPCDQ